MVQTENKGFCTRPRAMEQRLEQSFVLGRGHECLDYIVLIFHFVDVTSDGTAPLSLKSKVTKPFLVGLLISLLRTRLMYFRVGR